MKLTKLMMPVLFVLLCISLLIVSCDDGSTDPAADDPPTDTDEPDVIPPPENLMGTIALANGESAIMDIQFDDMAGGVRSTTVGVSGTIRYDEKNYIVGGLYDYSIGAIDIFAKHEVSGMKFIFSGIYTKGDGFSGTVILYESDGVTQNTSGTFSAIEADDDERSGIKFYTGIFGGDACGVWNGTLTTTEFYGNYAHYGDSSISRKFSMDRLETELTMNIHEENASGIGTISDDGSYISGYWGVSGDHGYWNGMLVDSNYDTPKLNDDSPLGLIANTSLQAIENIYSIGEGILEDSDPTVTGLDFTNSTDDAMVVIINNFTEPVTGLNVTGQMVVVYDADGDDDDTEFDISILIDSDVSGLETSSYSEGTGLTITFEGSSTISLYVDVTWNENTGVFTSGLGGTTQWKLNTDSVLSSVQLIYN
ncbi:MULTISPECIES: hypothetical protein [unclassified Oceanispirochaeta]|uniref:hypothetical protein n=1 Tax=unclassified Oceanispirochaeta TaxID=2635722 RepID=UPI000E091F62|nr:MULTISPECIES: hypothetical protein [unclassified Oceanispirochaeta]MBF9014926.1 hypothetical protein [Oceanispirochaeta sp. M2]NPD71393.1 hypothetical protein [Oceanispirochaeta sp. M1]RDG33358.1 hypothetical protein DV872_04690 [Oceanispirochaeta sp. M1]